MEEGKNGFERGVDQLPLCVEVLRTILSSRSITSCTLYVHPEMFDTAKDVVLSPVFKHFDMEAIEDSSLRPKEWIVVGRKSLSS